MAIVTHRRCRYAISMPTGDERLTAVWTCSACGERLGHSSKAGSLFLRSELVPIAKSHDGLPTFGPSDRVRNGKDARAYPSALATSEHSWHAATTTNLVQLPAYAYCPRVTCKTGQHIGNMRAIVNSE